MNPPYQRIYYTHYTKDSVTQSLRKRGAHNSYNTLRKFLDNIAIGTSVEPAEVNLHIYETGHENVAEAHRVINILNDKYGPPTQETKATNILQTFSFKRHLEYYPTWSIDTKTIQENLTFIDKQGTLPLLSTRPPIYMTVVFNFWLRHPAINPSQEDDKSTIIAFLSPGSNTISMTLVTPYALPDSQFQTFRATLQATCPIKLLDQHFYTRKFSATGKEYYRRVYSS